MIISALRSTSPERITLILEDGQEVPTTLGILTELRLFAGKDLDEEQLDLVKRKTSAALAREYGLTLLSNRQHSRKELGDKLLRKGTPDEAADDALDWLEDHGYLDDERYAGVVVRHYVAKGYGPGRIRMELTKRGISREHWDSAFSELPQTDDTIERDLRSRLRNPEDRDEVRKVSAALARRGFGWDEIKAAIERYHETY